VGAEPLGHRDHHSTVDACSSPTYNNTADADNGTADNGTADNGTADNGTADNGTGLRWRRVLIDCRSGVPVMLGGVKEPGSVLEALVLGPEPWTERLP
jgi:hypothetical protein